MRLLLAVAISWAILSVATVSMAEGEVTVTLAAMPAAVQKIINQRAADGTLGQIGESNTDGEKVFEVGFTGKDGEDRDFSVAEDGTLLSTQVTLAETPAPVQKTIQAQAGGWELESIDKNVDDLDASFDVQVTKDSREKSFTVAADGTLLSLETTLTNTPASVQETINKHAVGRSVEQIEQVFDEGAVSYDVETVSSNGISGSFSVTSDGRMASVEVTLAEVGPAVRRTIMEKAGGGKILRIDRSLIEKEQGVLPYEVQARKDGKPFDFSVGPRGRFLGMTD